MMNYQQTISYLYQAAPLFQNIGAGAYKEGLENTHTLDAHFGNPHTHFRTIHVAGTNGKGSVSSSLAAILQSAGLRVGLYTSPHLLDFRERIRVNGEMIPEERVVEFVEKERAFFEPLSPSFFELTTALAFLYFAEQQVDVAVVEVGLGGRLDCTNIIHPDLCVITNISFDHQQQLGNTLPAIAAEKAGIIKRGVSVVVGETNGHADVREVFRHAFEEKNADLLAANSCGVSLRFADEEAETSDTLTNIFQLKGAYQHANLRTIQCALSELRKQPFYASLLTPETIENGLAHVMELTGLRGRWQQLRERPRVVCDAGHNLAGIQYIVSQLLEQSCKRLHIVFGMVNDKDYQGALAELHKLSHRANFYFTQPSCKRALPASELASTFLASDPSAQVRTFPTVGEGVAAALSVAHEDDFVFVGGSCYVIADLLALSI